jgi:hypothetical protein
VFYEGLRFLIRENGAQGHRRWQFCEIALQRPDTAVVVTSRCAAIRAITAYVFRSQYRSSILEGERVMTDKPETPRFQSEAEEAQWWFEHREESALWLARAATEGRTSNLAGIREKRKQGGPTPQFIGYRPAF